MGILIFQLIFLLSSATLDNVYCEMHVFQWQGGLETIALKVVVMVVMEYQGWSPS